MEREEIKEEILNAVIKDISWNRERLLTQTILIEGDGWGSVFGNYHLGGSACSKWIIAIMDMFELTEFSESDLIGKIVRAKFKGNKICAIGHPIKDLWVEHKGLLRED